MFENRVLRGIFGPKRDEGTGEWGKLHNKELSGLYSSPNIFRVIKSRRIRWMGHVARVGESRGVDRVLVETSEAKDTTWKPMRRSEDNIKMDLRKWNVRIWTGSMWLGIGTGGGHL